MRLVHVNHSEAGMTLETFFNKHERVNHEICMACVATGDSM